MDERCELLCIDLPRAERLRLQRLDGVAADVFARRAQAFADPTRLMLASALFEGGELCVCDLAWISERAQNLVSHHLQTLRREGLVSSRRQGKLVLYSLTDDGERLLAAVLANAQVAV
jgi:DNA-binding transcriptional ArsR family regulator